MCWKSMSRKFKINIGDVFTVPLSDDQSCYGQVLGIRHPIYYLAAFDALVPSGNSKIKDISTAKILFLGAFINPFKVRPTWLMVGNTQARNETGFPAHRILSGGNYYVETWDGSHRRLATEEEVALLDNSITCSAAVLESALKAHFGLGEWEPKFHDTLKYEYVNERCRIKV
jgi:Immunity protein 26